MQGPDTEAGFRTNILPGRELGEPALETGSQTQLGVLKAKSSRSAWSLFKKGRDGSIGLVHSSSGPLGVLLVYGIFLLVSFHLPKILLLKNIYFVFRRIP